MKKYILIFLIPVFILSSCIMSQDIKDNKKTEIIPKQIEKIQSGNSKNNVGNIKQQINNNSGILRQEKINIKNLPFVSKLLDIEKNGIKTSLINEKEFHNFINNNSGSVFIGNEEDWKDALSLPCKNSTGKVVKVYSRFETNFDNSEHPLLDMENVCVKNFDDNKSLGEFFEHLNKGTKKIFKSEELDSIRLKSKLELITPIERLLYSEFFYENSITRFVGAQPYKNEIIMLYIHSQEPGIGYYYIVRIYLKDGKLYIKEELINKLTTSEQFSTELDLIYGNKFYDNLSANLYEIGGNLIDSNRKKFDSEEIRLLQGDWLKNPSIINKKIEERLMKDLNNLTK